MRVLVVDDEPLALERLADLLGQIEDVEMVGAVQSGAEAISRIAELNPDLLLIDIEMPKVDGFDVVESLPRLEADDSPAPLVCFVTAYPHFAIEAFDTGALDFLCKPVRLSRLQRTIERAEKALKYREADRRLEELVGQLGALRRSRSPSEERSVWLHYRGEMIRIPLSSIDWIRAESEYVRLHVGEQSYLLRSSITAVAKDLADEGFVRIHRSIVVNTDRLAAVRSSRAGMKVDLSGGASLPVGRSFRKEVRRIVSRGDA